jgi:hypothetical protein
MTTRDHSELNRIYEDLSEDGRLDQPPRSPARLHDWEPASEETGALELAPHPTSEESVDPSVDTLERPGMDDVYDELGEGSVRFPGAGHDSEPPEADEESWLGSDERLA